MTPQQIAHDLNNELTIIMCSVDTILRGNFNLKKFDRERLEQAIKSCRACAVITKLIANERLK